MLYYHSRKNFKAKSKFRETKNDNHFLGLRPWKKNPFSILNKGEVYIILSFVLKTVNAEIHPKTHFPL